MRTAFIALLLTACNQNADQLNRIEAKVDQIANRQQLPAPQTPEEYNRIKTGSEYLAPDGTIRVKRK